MKRKATRIKFSVIAALTPLLLLLLTAPLLAKDQETEWRLSADRIVGTAKAEPIEAWGHATIVEATAADRKLPADEFWELPDLLKTRNYLRADHIKYFQSSGKAYLRGNIESRWDGYEIYAEEAEMDLKTQRGTLRNGVIFTSDQHIWIKGEEVRKTGKQTYVFTNAEITSCDGETPAWSIKTSEGDLTVGGYANVWHPRFRVKDVPVLYAPFATVPIKTERESGLLFPLFGTSSRLGTFYSQPLYWAIGDESDMTFWGDYYDKRGTLLGLEYRHTPDLRTKGVWQADWIWDRKVAQSEAAEDDQFDSDGLVRDNHERYWVRGMYDGWLFDPEFETKLTLDFASDQDYLRTFDIGHTSFDATEDMFLDEFGRGLDLIDSKTRTSTGLISRNWSLYSINAKAEYTQNFEYMNGNSTSSTDPTVQRLPEFSAYAYKQELSGTPLEWDFASNLGYYYRNYGNTGSRLNLNPGVSLPLSGQYGAVIPSFEWTQTVYGIDQFEDNPDGRSDESVQHRGVPHANVSAFSEVFKVINLDTSGDNLIADPQYAGNSAWTALRHSIQPRLEYDWIPFVEQGDKPFFDDSDRLEPTNQLHYSLINIFNRRLTSVVLRQGEGGTTADLTNSYREFLRIRLEQAYDQREATRDEDRDEFERRPFSDILAEVIVRPDDYFWLGSKTFYSPYEGDVTKQDLSVGANIATYGTASVSYTFLDKINEYKRQRDERVHMLTLAGTLYMPKRFELRGKYQVDIEDNSDVLKQLALTYKHQCYDLTAFWESTENEDRISFWVTIMGFETPHIGFTPDSLMGTSDEEE